MKLGEPIFKARSVSVKDLSVGDFPADHLDEMLAYVAPAGRRGKDQIS